MLEIVGDYLLPRSAVHCQKYQDSRKVAEGGNGAAGLNSGTAVCTTAWAKYPPRLNHTLIFNTDDHCFHGFPEPLQRPEGVFRKSLALYYYTVGSSAKGAARSTNYRARPNDGWGTAALIWLDKQAVDVYSRAKRCFGFSDTFASKVLGLISRKG
jgi:hypothetical protein